MDYTFVQTPRFTAKWRSLGLTDEDLRELEQQLLLSATSHPVMAGTRGIRKMRFAPPSWNRGKSGAARVCYVCFSAFATILLALVFTKNEQANLTAAQRALARGLVAQMAAELEKSHEVKRRR